MALATGLFTLSDREQSIEDDAGLPASLRKLRRCSVACKPSLQLDVSLLELPCSDSNVDASAVMKRSNGIVAGLHRTTFLVFTSHRNPRLASRKSPALFIHRRPQSLIHPPNQCHSSGPFA